MPNAAQTTEYMQALNAASAGCRAGHGKLLNVEANSFLGKCVNEIKIHEEQINAALGTGDRTSTECASAIRQIIYFFRYRNLSLRQCVFATLSRLGAAAYKELIQIIPEQSQMETKIACILSLGALARFQNMEVRELGLRCLDAQLNDCNVHTDPRLFQAYARALRYHGGHAATQVLSHRLSIAAPNQQSIILEELAWCPDLCLLQTVYEHLRIKSLKNHEVFESLGLILRPGLISEGLDDAQMRGLGLRFGYLDQNVSDLLANDQSTKKIQDLVVKLLDRIGLASEIFLQELSSGQDLEDLLLGWERRISEFRHALKSDFQTEVRDLTPLNLANTQEAQVDRFLFFAALREQDLLGNIQAKAEPHPFRISHHDQGAATFSLKSQAEFTEKIFFTRIAECASLLAKSAAPAILINKLLPYMVVDSFLADLDTRPEYSAEQRLQWASKWSALGRVLEMDDSQIGVRSTYQAALGRSFPTLALAENTKFQQVLAHQINIRNCKMWRFAILSPQDERRAQTLSGEVKRQPAWRALCFGTRSAIQVAALRACITKKESEFEATAVDLIYKDELAQGSSLKLSIGLELQNLSIPWIQHSSWKQALISMGIPSPSRRMFYYMVEAAPKPTYSVDTIASIVSDLCDLEFCKNPNKGLTVHVSFGADFGEEGKYLAMALDAANIEDPMRATKVFDRKSLGRVMSKGLVYRNTGSQAVCEAESKPECHTELRTWQLRGSSVDELKMNAKQVLVDIHRLALCAYSALQAKAGINLNDIDLGHANRWQSFRENVHELWSRKEFGSREALLAAWNEGTGDPRDVDLFSNLELTQAWERREAFLALNPGARQRLRGETLKLWHEAIG